MHLSRTLLPLQLHFFHLSCSYIVWLISSPSESKAPSSSLVRHEGEIYCETSPASSVSTSKGPKEKSVEEKAVRGKDGQRRISWPSIRQQRALLRKNTKSIFWHRKSEVFWNLYERVHLFYMLLIEYCKQTYTFFLYLNVCDMQFIFMENKGYHITGTVAKKDLSSRLFYTAQYFCCRRRIASIFSYFINSIFITHIKFLHISI